MAQLLKAHNKKYGSQLQSQENRRRRELINMICYARHFCSAFLKNLHNIPKDYAFYSHLYRERTLQRLIIMMIRIYAVCLYGLVL